ncbi:MAG: ATP-dependent DNA helicase RecG [Acidiferrobacteraceae bacterium]
MDDGLKGPPGLRAPAGLLPGVGPKVSERLARMGLSTLADLLLHLPFRYEDRTHVTAIAALREDEDVLIEGEIIEVRRAARGRTALACVIDDGTARALLRFFHLHPSQERMFSAGRRLTCFGRARGSFAGFEFAHPQCLFGPGGAVESHLTPVYHTVSGLGQVVLRRIIQAALERMPAELARPLDALGAEGFASTAEALRFLHHPPAGARVRAETRHPAERRLALEELVGFELRAHERRILRRHEPALPLAHHGVLAQGLRRSLPFMLTQGQEEALREIVTDLGRTYPMRRLLQGDVGCGKTVIAALATAHAVDSGAQAVLMAPTELLAEQHWRNFDRWFSPLGQPVVWLSGMLGARERAAALAALSSGRARIAVGTHALFQQGVEFCRLGLICIDEQHRFGVAQRAALAAKADGYLPHQLFMTATPIPRTLAQTFYADLDVSEIRERPSGRRPVMTSVLPQARRGEVVARVREACRAGRQAYWVCPAIEESPMDLKAATTTAEKLRAELPELAVGLVHGRMASAEKERVMRAFSEGRLPLLVATTVIEVGVDVRNASLMVVEHAERMGLAQLHQLRGRVGRGEAESHCLLLYAPPLTEVARERLRCLRATDDGFAVAEQDLALRGPGELFGSRQAGSPVWRVADLARDRDLLPAAGALAAYLLQDAPEEAERLRSRWMLLHDLGARA